MSITIQNLRIIPYGQKDTLKPVFGDTMHLTFTLADAPQACDGYTLALDYERILLPTMRPLCAMATEYTATGTDISFELEINTERFALWVSTLKKPTPVWLQLQRERGGVYTTILLDDVLALPSVVDGANMVFPGTPLEDALKKKLDKPTEAGQTGNVLKLGEDGEPFWGEGGGGGGSQQATDAEIDARESTTHTITPNNLDYAVRSVLPNVTTIPAATTSYSLLDASATTNNHSWQYFHAPEAASTYAFPAVADDTVAHRIKLTIDFTDVQTYAFEDVQGVAISPLFTPTITAGDVYEFDCEYSAVKGAWLVWPHKQGAVSDDYVMQSQVGAANGVAGLDADGTVPSAQLPPMGATRGGISFRNGYGLQQIGDYLLVNPATNATIAERSDERSPITPPHLNYAVTAALTDANKISLTDAQKASAQDTLGVGAAPIIGTTAPTTSTAGSVGQLYVDTTTSKTYHCTAVTTSGDPEVTTYTWVDDINAMGGVLTAYPSTITVKPSNGIFAGDSLSCSMIESIGCGGSLAGYVAKSLLAVDSSKLRAYKSIIWGIGHGTPDDYYHTSLLLGGKYTVEPSASSGLAVFIGGGASTSDRRNIEELSWSGDLYVAGGNQQGITVIPPDTTAYTLAEGAQSHIPSSAPTYTLPSIPQRIIADGRYFTRNPSTDGTGYYGWLSGTTNRYTASATPAVGDNTYTNTALTSGAKAITAIDERTHECILTIRFSASVLTYAFEDSAGNTITPLPLAGTIQDGSVVCFRCTWEALLNSWVIMPVMLGTYQEVEP